MRRTSCCLCRSSALEVVLPLEPSPIGDAFVTAEQCAQPQPIIPLDVALCRDCGHVQLMDIVHPEHLFVDYLFQTQTSPGLVRHFQAFAEHAIQKYSLTAGDVVIEIGSNDGALLQFFQQAGLNVLGIDPAQAPSAAARARGLPTETAFFTSKLAAEISDRVGPARLVVANNVFAHSENLGDMADGIRMLLHPDGVFTFEVSYLLDIIDRKLFDTIYHEHISYHSLKPLARFFREHGLQMISVEPIPTKGGSMRVIVQRDDGPAAVDEIVPKMIAEEDVRGLAEPPLFQRFASDLLLCRDQIAKLMDSKSLTRDGVAGYGASTTATTLIAHFQLADRFACMLDDNPLKQGRFSPGWHHPVYASNRLATDPPGCVIILAWNYADPILQRCSAYREQGGQFLIPLPEPRLV